MYLADPYSFRARVQPALVTVLPFAFLVFALLPKDPFFVTAFFGLLGAAGGTAVVTQMGRDQGYKKQGSLWQSWGGSSTTRLLRHRHIPDDITLATELRQQIEEWVDQPLPTEQEEEADPVAADQKYELVVRSLLEATRDRDRFPLVFAENVNYGFRRNLWGLRLTGTLIAVVLALVSWVLFSLTVWGRPWPDPWWSAFVMPDSVATIRVLVAVADTALATFWLFWVRPSWVKVVADIYAKQLMESVRTLKDH